MTKLSIVASRALVGFGVVALTSTATFAAQVVVEDNTKFQAEFSNNNGNWTNKNDTTKGTGKGVDISSNTWNPAPIVVPATPNTPATTLPINSITIDTTDADGVTGTINVNGKLGVYQNAQDNDLFYGVKLVGDTTITATNGILGIGKNSSITGNVTNNGEIFADSATLDITGNVSSDSGKFSLGNNGVINVKGNLTANNTTAFDFFDSGLINVQQHTKDAQGKFTDGKFTLANSNTISYTTTKRQLADDVVIANAQGGFWKGATAADELKTDTAANATAANTFLGGISVTNPYDRKISSLLSNPNLLAGTSLEDTNITNGSTTLSSSPTFNYGLGLSNNDKTLSIIVTSDWTSFNVSKDSTQAQITTAIANSITEIAGNENTAITNALNSINAGITTTTTAISTAEGAINTANAALKTAQTDLANAQKALAEATTDTDKATAQTAIDTANTAIATQQGIVATRTESLNTAKSQEANLKAAYAELDARQKAYTEAISSLAADASDSEKLRANLVALVGANNAGIAQNVLFRVLDTREDANGNLINNNLMTALLTPAGIDDLRNTSIAVANTGNTSEGLGILASLARSTSVNDNDKLNVITHNRFFRDTRDAGRSASTFSNASTSALSVMNVSNDMALGGRIAKANNPYSQKLAAIGSDAAYPYYENYTASVWANAFGGANIIDGNNGGVYGITLGVDGNVTDNFLLGAYFTYADSDLKDDLLKQESDNFQIGLYSLIKLPQDWEIGLKGFGQFGSIDQYRHNGAAGTSTADFDSKFFGLSGNVGKVIGFENGLYLKPFVGLNYYYSTIDDYTESGTFGQHVHSMSNNSFSADIGLELRKYFSNNSYIYATPKIEQYLVNNGDDYVARFAGSDTTYTIAGDDKKRTYGQLVLGANIEVTEALALQLGVGAKQILANKVDDKNETYLSGNLGLKYKF